MRVYRTTPIPERFWAKVKRPSVDACWLWLAGCGRGGYGKFYTGGSHGKNVLAHRLSWELTHGPIPDGLCVLHDCPGGDNPSCVNPAHLWLGTHADNIRDRDAKGRTACGERSGLRRHPERRACGVRNGHATHPERTPRGEQVNTARLTEPQVRVILQRLHSGATSRALGLEYGVPTRLIHRIHIRETWRHIT